MITNDLGRAVDCVFYIAKDDRPKCKALKMFYYEDNDSCDGCPFFKTSEQLKDQKERCKRRLSFLRADIVMM